MSILEEGIRSMQQAGVVSVLLPFALIFAIIFGILQKIQIFGKDSKKFNVIISIVLGLIPVVQHVLYPGSRFDVITPINKSIPSVALVLVAIVALFLILGLFGAKGSSIRGTPAGLVSIAAIVFLIYVFGSNYGLNWWTIPGYQIFSRENVSIAVAIAVFALVIGYVTADDKEKKSGDRLKKFAEDLGFKD